MVTVFGPAGVGKTRLVREALRRLEKGRHDVGVVATACPSGGAAAPWSSAIALIGALCGLGAGADDDRLLEAAARLRALGVTDDDADGVLAAIGTAPGAAIDEPRDGNLVARAFARAIRSLCRDRAHVFAWDAAEALDAWTADALADLADERDGLRALVVLASREAPLASFARDDHHLALELGELDLDDTARLIAARLGARVVPANVLAACRARGGGAPRALEDAARELVAAGAITLQDGVAALDAERASAGS